MLFPSGPPAYTNLHYARHPYLAVDGSCDKWFLCAKVCRPDLVTWEVVYNVTAGVLSNDYVFCGYLLFRAAERRGLSGHETWCGGYQMAWSDS